MLKSRATLAFTGVNFLVHLPLSRCYTTNSAAAEILALAVLQPRKLTVYTVEPVGGKGAKASYYNLVSLLMHCAAVTSNGRPRKCLGSSS
jgi:hypothetical protein